MNQLLRSRKDCGHVQIYFKIYITLIDHTILKYEEFSRDIKSILICPLLNDVHFNIVALMPIQLWPFKRERFPY